MIVRTEVHILFATGNDACSTPAAAAHILRALANDIEAGHAAGRVHDVNGNSVGEWTARFPRTINPET